MKYLSKVASVVCIAAVAISLSGCGGGGSTTAPAATPPAPAPEGTPCPIPPSVQEQNIVLDQNKTKDLLGLSAMSSMVGLDIIKSHLYNFEVFNMDSQESSKNKLSKALVKKASNLLNIAKSKKIEAQSAGYPVGDNLACDEGSYSFHYTIADSGSMEDGYDIDRKTMNFQISFNNCLIHEGSEHEDDIFKLVGFLLKLANYDEMIFEGYGTEEGDGVLTINGSSNLDADIEVKYRSSIDRENDDRKIYFNIALSNQGIDLDITSSEYSFTFDSDGLFAVTSDISVLEETKFTEGEDGNTTSSSFSVDYELGLDMNLKETWHDVYDDGDDMLDITALCFNTEYTGKIKGNTYLFEAEGEDDIVDNHIVADVGSVGNGYASIYEKYEEEDGVDKYFDDLYQNQHTIASLATFDVVHNPDVDQEDRNNTFSINGIVGSTLVGGSAMFDTVVPWKSSNQYESALEEEYISIKLFTPYDFIQNMPYTGKTVITSANQATVGFGLDEEEQPYGYIKIDDGAPVEYNSLRDMFNVDDD